MISFFLLFIMIVLPVSSTADVARKTERFEFPSIPYGDKKDDSLGIRLDYCLSFGRDCGQPAADYFCRQNGYERASHFRKEDKIGHTKTLKTGEICKRANKNCGGFKYITCERTGVRIEEPKEDNIAVDLCLTWGTNCGQPAADYFCRKENFVGALGYKEAERIGHTKILKTGQICQEPKCSGFAYIDCDGTFLFPKIDEVPLDWCLDLGTSCGEIVAQEYCRQRKNLPEALDYEEYENIGYTKTLETGRICKGENCGGFVFIKCGYYPPGTRFTDADSGN
jgi:hypothetical protein